MKHKILLLLFLFSLLPSWGWGQETEVTKTIELDKLKGSYEITDPGEYTFKGEYKGTPDIDTNGGPKPVINVAAGLDLDVTIILNEVKIDLTSSDGCPLSAKDASKVKLILKGRNTLMIIGSYYPGIWTPEKVGCGIIIDKDIDNHGSLDIKIDNHNSTIPGIGSFYNSTNAYIRIDGGSLNIDGGIGGFPNSIGGEIIITGGTVIATSRSGAGIGSGESSSGSNITITGGTVTATSSSGAGIGSGGSGSGSNITITGGTVTATSYSGAGIGGGDSSINSNITITGGKVTATSTDGAGIGNGKAGSSSTFSTGDNGTAFINTSSISDPSYKAPGANTKGLIFDDDKGAIYGDSYILAANATIESGQTLTINNNQTLIIKEGVTLVNKGTINNEGIITNNGMILLIGSGKIEGKGQVSPNPAVNGFEVIYKLNYDNSPADHIEYVENGGLLPTYNVNRKYYEFDGWYDNATGNTKVTTINQSTTVYAHWKKNEIKVVKSIPIISSSVGTNNFQAYELDNLLEESSYKEGITYNWVNESTEHYGLDIISNQIIGTPDKVTDDNANIKIKISGENCEDQVVDIPIKIEKGNVMIDMTVDHNCIYSGKVVDIEIPVYNYSIKEIGKASLVYYLEEIPKTTPENSGATYVGGAPKFAGEYRISARYLGDKNYSKLENNRIKFIISPKELNITPLPDQKLFEGETIKYKVTGAVEGEVPTIDGTLKAENGIIKNNNLELTDIHARNYSLTIDETVPITYIDDKSVMSHVTLSGSKNGTAYEDQVTFEAPDGFEIALVSAITKSSPTNQFGKSFVFNKVGNHTITFKLRRKNESRESNEFSTDITIVKSQYIPDNGGNNNNDSSFTEHKVEIPEVEGISVDKGFGEHWIENWGSFIFTITIEEGYRMLSLPVVKVNDSEIAFSSRTDTTYTYKVKYICAPKNITITGIIKDPATANTAIKAPEENIKIINGVAYITVAKPTEFAVIDMEGNTISINKLAPGETPIYNLPRMKPLLFWFDKKRAGKMIISNR